MKIAKIIRIALPAIGFSCCVLSAMAQAPVSDVSTSQQRVQVTEGYGTESTASRSDTGGTESGAMFRQFQQLQEEVATLRGQLEEQSYELQKLKQQHQEDFASLDRRISGGGAPSNVSANATSTGSTASTNQNLTSVGAVGNDDGREEYEAAYSLLKAKDYGGASTAFKAFVGKYPQSDYAGSSWFWLGFVYQTQGDMDAAAKAFSSLIEQFPRHSKADDAKYNLGKIYHQQGKTDQARVLLKEVAAGSSKSAPLAKSYLESM
ncbi:MAG TPA: tol-pal system protein YbgF [Pseudomonadales bacterium]|nr:tol-pal system protein YbgF [Pseudomonadales bacterium]